MMKLTTLFAVSVSLILSGFCSLGVQAHPVQEDSSGVFSRLSLLHGVFRKKGL